MKTRPALLQGSMLLLLLIASLQLLHSLPITIYPYLRQVDQYFVMNQGLNYHHMISLFLGLMMLFNYGQLWKKMRLAWMIELILLFSALILHTVFFHWSVLPLMAAELLCFGVLLRNERSFPRRSNALSLKGSISFIAVVTLSLFLYILLTIVLIHQETLSLWVAIKNTLRLQFLLDQNAVAATIRGKVYANTLVITDILLMSLTVIAALIPQLYRLRHRGDRQRLVQWVQDYGQNPRSYLALEDDKDYFFSRLEKGVAAYNKVGKVFTVCGDPICAPEQMKDFLLELISHCVQNGLSLLFINCTERFLDLYRELEFGLLRLGADAILDLEDFSQDGKRRDEALAAVQQAETMGIDLLHYDPAQARNPRIEEQMRQIDARWQDQKGIELRFMVGSANLENPLDRQYYCAMQGNHMLGYAVFFPYDRQKGWLAEVARRLPETPQDVMELLITKGFSDLAEQGAKRGNLGFSSLGPASFEEALITKEAADVLFDEGNHLELDELQSIKEKYPSQAEARYLVFLPKPLSANMAMAHDKVQREIPLLQLLKDVMGR